MRTCNYPRNVPSKGANSCTHDLYTSKNNGIFHINYHNDLKTFDINILYKNPQLYSCRSYINAKFNFKYKFNIYLKRIDSIFEVNANLLNIYDTKKIVYYTTNSYVSKILDLFVLRLFYKLFIFRFQM